MVQSYLLGDAYDTYDQVDLIMGYYGQVAYKVNGGDFSYGADFSLSNIVTPVFNDIIGMLSEQQLKIKPGGLNVTEVGKIQYLNGESYLNKPVLVYNGTYNTTVMQCTTDVFTFE